VQQRTPLGFGSKARAYAEQTFHIEQITSRFEEILTQACGASAVTSSLLEDISPEIQN